MTERPYWGGQIRISLVTFSVSLKSAVRRSSQIPLHEYERKSGQRIHHRNVIESGQEVDDENIVKGYETEGGFVPLEKEEIDDIKLPSSDVLSLETFIETATIPTERFERPYYVLPSAKDDLEIYAVIHQALLKSGMTGIGQLTMRGREELCAVIPVEKGLMLQTLRYDQEIVIDDDILPGGAKKKLNPDYVDLADQLIRKNAAKTDFSKFHDHYHEALLDLIDAKRAHKKPKAYKAEPANKVVDFADALRRSLGALKGGASKPAKAQAKNASKRKSA